MTYGEGGTGPASKHPVLCGICRKTLAGTNELRKHLACRHAELGVTLRKAIQTKETTKQRKLERQVVARHGPATRWVQCSKKDCKIYFHTSLTCNGLRCKRHRVITSEEAAQRGGFMVPRGIRICRLMWSKLFVDENDEPIRSLAIVAPAWKDSVLTVYHGKLVKLQPESEGEMLLMVHSLQGEAARYNKGYAIKGNSVPTPFEGMAQFANQPDVRVSTATANTRIKWTSEKVKVRGKWMWRPKAELIALGNAFEYASESNPIEALLSYNDSRRILDFAGYDNRSGAHIWDEESQPRKRSKKT